VAFSTTTGDHMWVADLAARLKEVLPGVPNVTGGAHPTFFPQFIEKPSIDFICRGEGEEALLELMDALEKGGDSGSIPNIWAKIDGHVRENDVRPLIEPLDRLPFADRSLYFEAPFFKRDRVLFMLFSRGCPFNCSYCFNAASRALYRGKGRYVRLRSVAHSLEEAAALKERYNPRTFYFVDDLFGLDATWTESFLERYAREIRVPFICNTHVRYVTDEFAEGLRAANCSAVQFGVESGNDEVRERILGRRCSKDEIVRAASRLRRHGIPFTTFNIIGCPGETTDQAFETIDLNTEIGTDYPSFSLFQAYPQTPIHDYAVQHGYIQHSDIDAFPASFYFSTAVQQDNIHELVNLQRLYLLAIRLPRLRVLFRWLVKLPPNRIFDWIYLASFGLQYARRTKRGVVRTLVLGLRNLKFWRS